MEPVGTPVDFEESRWVAILSFGVTRGNQVVPDVILVILVHGEKEADVNDHLFGIVELGSNFTVLQEL